MTTLNIPGAIGLTLHKAGQEHHFVFSYGDGIVIPRNQFKFIKNRRFIEALECALSIDDVLCRLVDYFNAGGYCDTRKAKNLYHDLSNLIRSAQWKIELDYEPLEFLYQSWCHGGEIPKKYQSNTPQNDAPKYIPKAGYIYLVQAIEPENHYKIGLSVDPISRIDNMGVKLPFPIEIIHLIKTNDMKGAEKQLHNTYSSKHINGEWFKLNPHDVNEISKVDELNIGELS